MIESWFVAHLVLILSYGLAIVGIAHMLRHRRSPGSTMAWLLVFVGLPFVGTALYLMFGGSKLKKRRRVANTTFDLCRAVSAQQASPFDLALRSYGAPPATGGNHVTLCKNGVEGYRRLIELIEQAEHRICMATFIFSNDAIGQDILDRLVGKAKNGIEIRLLIDGLGSVKTPRHMFKPLLKAGGQYAKFQPVVHLPFRSRTNLRNHRKIVVADGKRSFAGGMNITHDDIYPEQTDRGWQDLSLVIDGPAAGHLESIFREDWQFATGKSWDQVSESAVGAANDSEIVQVLASGPDVPNDPMYSASMTAIFRASRRIWIVTPYFVPNDGLFEALVFACQRGVDVRILIPAASNHPISDLAGACLLREIHAAGGIVQRNTKGMVHAKVMIVDEEFATVVSANFDMRSLFLNYEVMQVCYSAATIDAVANWFLSLETDCTADSPQPGFVRELCENALRALSPMF